MQLGTRIGNINTSIIREFQRAGLSLATPTNDIFVRSIDEEIAIPSHTIFPSKTSVVFGQVDLRQSLVVGDICRHSR
jgi:hypothetical protein